MGGGLRAEGAFCCFQPGLELLEELQAGLSFLGRMSLVVPGVLLLRSGLCLPWILGTDQGQIYFGEDLLMWGRQSAWSGVGGQGQHPWGGLG